MRRDARGLAPAVTAAVATPSQAATAADPLTHGEERLRGEAPGTSAFPAEPGGDRTMNEIAMPLPRSAMAVGDAMTRDPIVLRDDDAVTVAAQVLDAAHISGAPVVDARGILVGVLSRTDLLHARATGRLWERWQGLRVRQLMHWPAVTVLATLSLDDAATLMEREHVHRLVVVEPGRDRPVGILSATDLVHAMVGGSRR